MTRELDARSEASLKWIIDIGERAFSVILFASFVARLSPSLMLKPINGLAVISEGLVVFFMVVRRHTSDVTTRPFDWIVAFATWLTCVHSSMFLYTQSGISNWW